MRICIDIDGTICHLRQSSEHYEEVRPIENAANKLKQFKEDGHYIILCTARHMKTCDSNVGKVVALQAETLINWLKKHEFVYDELWFGKPYAHVYIDDKAFQFQGSWDEIDEKLLISYK